MSLWDDRTLAAAVGGVASGPFAASGVAIDSRLLKPGEVFVALRGARDGHDFVRAALAAGAAAAVVDRDVGCGPVVRVADTAQALWAMGAAGRARFAGPVAAVTGSVGKTTVKEMLRLCLAGERPAHAAEASFNNHLGVPLTLARLPPDAAACVLEIGMNHPGEIAPLSRLARPDVAVVTAIGSAHIGQMGSLAAIAAEKATIAAGLGPEGVAVLPADSAFLPALRPEGRRVLTFGVADGADARLEGFEDGVVRGRVLGRAVRFGLAAPGRHMALNALAAVLAAQVCGVAVERAASLLAGFAPGAGRGAVAALRLPGGTAWLLDESYNASPESMRAALALLGARDGRRIAVLGEMRELGDFTEAEHTALAGPVSGAADMLFTVGPAMRGLFDAVPVGVRGAHVTRAEEVLALLEAVLAPGDVVLLKGSNGLRLGMVAASLRARFGADGVAA